MAVISKDLGAVTAYAAAVNRGYTGTKEEFETLMASYATVAQQAAASASSAGQSATDASGAATTAETAKTIAQAAASSAQTYASASEQSAQSAQASAQSAQGYAQTAESAKDTAVNAVDGFAAGAQQALDGVNQAGNNWKSLAQAQKLDAEAWATGKRDGADVGSSDETYHNNAKYYAESAGTDATTATDAAQTATTKASEAQASAEAAAESARTLTIDATLTQAGQAADSKAVGDAITELKNDCDNLSERSNNLLDANNADVVKMNNVNGTTNPQNMARSVIVPVTVTTQTKITATKTVASQRFAIATFTDYPVAYSTSVNVKSNNTATSLTVDVDSTIKYVMIYFWLESADTTVTPQEVLDGMMVEFGDTFTGYEPYYVVAISDHQVAEIRGEIPNDINNLKLSDNYAFAPLVLGYKSYIEYDTVAETITIPRDVAYLGNKINGSAIYKALNTDAPYVISNVNYNTFTTTSLKLVLDTDDWDFKLISYNTGNVSKYKLVAAVRLKSSTYQGGLCTPFPWKIDGKLYGIDLSPYDTVATLFDYNSFVKTVAHRGWYTAPENTLVSYKTARKQGCLYGETDVAFTSDNIPVLMHDDTINRTCCNATDGSALGDTPIYVSSLTYNNGSGTLYNYDACKPGKWAEFKGTKIPTLDEFCKLCRNIGLKPYIELKISANLNQTKVNTIVDVVVANGLADVVTFNSFSATYLGYAKTALPGARLVYTPQSALNADAIATAQGLKSDDNEVVISAAASMLSDESIALCKTAKIPLEAYDIESLVGIRNADPYITGFTISHFVVGAVLYNYFIQ